MYAIIRSGARQYKAIKGETISVNRLKGEVGDDVTFSEVLMVGGDNPKVGVPLVKGASVIGKIKAQTFGPKVYAFRYLRRKNSKKKHGFKQSISLVEIADIKG